MRFTFYLENYKAFKTLHALAGAEGTSEIYIYLLIFIQICDIVDVSED